MLDTEAQIGRKDSKQPEKEINPKDPEIKIDSNTITYQFQDKEKVVASRSPFQTGEMVEIIRTSPDGTENRVLFDRTGRDLRWFRPEGFVGYPPETFKQENLKGRVLDMGTGRGDFVEDLRKMGVDAYGMDIWLEYKQRNSDHFMLGLAERTNLPSEWASKIFINTMLHYSTSDEMRKKILTEMVRILEPKGKIFISPVHDHAKEEYLKAIEGLSVKAVPKPKEFEKSPYLELQKEDTPKVKKEEVQQRRVLSVSPRKSSFENQFSSQPSENKDESPLKENLGNTADILKSFLSSSEHENPIITVKFTEEELERLDNIKSGAVIGNTQTILEEFGKRVGPPIGMIGLHLTQSAAAFQDKFVYVNTKKVQHEDVPYALEHEAVEALLFNYPERADELIADLKMQKLIDLNKTVNKYHDNSRHFAAIYAEYSLAKNDGTINNHCALIVNNMLDRIALLKTSNKMTDGIKSEIVENLINVVSHIHISESVGGNIDEIKTKAKAITNQLDKERII